MTGTGTQADPYIVDSWSEFVSVADKAVYITCPENSVWDMSEQPPDGITDSVNFLFNEFNGNGLVIKNLYANGGSLVIGNSHYAIKIKSVSFIELSTSSKNSVIFKSVYSSKHGYGRAFQNCKFAGAITSGALFTLPGQGNSVISFMNDGEKSCLFDIFLGEGTTFNAVSDTSFTDCYIKLSGHTTTSFTGKYTRCYFSGESPFAGPYGIDSQHITNSVFDIVIPQGSCVSITSGNAKKCVINKDKLLGGYYCDPSAMYFPIEVTTEQLSDAEYLKSQGFAIATEEPYANDEWRISKDFNDGKPYTGYMPVKQSLDVGYDIWSLERENVIRIYDISEPQDDFKHNGLAILDPLSCVSLKNHDTWDVTLTHPLDKWGKWKYLLIPNVLKVDGQLFRIDVQENEFSADGGYITVHAAHITYDMADDLIQRAVFEGGNAQQFLDFCFENGVMKTDDHYHIPYKFEYYSDIDTVKSGDEYINTSLWAAIVGVDNCLLNRYGGELYRNNFYFSVCKRMEGASDNAFFLRYDLDMTKIKQTIDYRDFCTNLWCEDNFGNGFGISYTSDSKWAIHHPKRRMYQFNYTDFEDSFDRLVEDTQALWRQISTPKVTYEMQFASLRSDPRYTEFMKLQNYNYGDQGVLYCPELDIYTTQQISEIEKDEITGDIISMKLGSLSSSLIRPNFMGSTVTSGRSSEDKQNRVMQDMIIGTSIASAEKYAINRLEQLTIKQLQGG